jgi:lysyl-tRNA synthetase class II
MSLSHRKEEVTVLIAGRISRRATQGKLFFYDVNGDGAKVMDDF